MSSATTSYQQPIPQRNLRPALVFLNGELLAVPVPLERASVTLGSGLEADVRINDARVSRLHAQILTETNVEANTEKYRLINLDAKNETLLNNQTIDKAYLQSGDKISLGNQLLRFELLDEIDREFQLQIHRLISRDELTGLLSSRSFFSELRREAARATVENRSFCVLMIDLDHFKAVNDTYGHVTGSQTLAETSACIMQSLRAGDVAARFGGEEFAVFLLNATLPQGLVAADRIRSIIEEREFTVTRQLVKHLPSTHHITVSIGVAEFPRDSRDPIELVEMADAALYRAKQTGRNCVCAYRQMSLEESTAQILPTRELFSETKEESLN